jgi:NADP-dependent 3-hydroxy acid dehydrogenase YdfG
MSILPEGIPMTGISGKVVAITGASSGIGEATARMLAERGAAVVLGARRTERLDKLAQEIRDRDGRAIACPTDVTRPEDVQRLADRAVAEFGRLDVLVSNAGISKIGPMADLDVDGWSAMIDVNLVTTVSTAGLKIVPTQAVYAATKNAVRTLLEGLRQESTDGVLRTTAISPGFVRTELADSIDNPEVREQIRRSRDEFAIPPEAVARAIAFAIEQPDDVEISDMTIRPTVQG